MELTAELIHGFAGSMLAKRYDGATPTPQCHMEWWDLCASKDPLVAIAAPRAHGKSTAVSHAYLLAALMFRERKFALIVSDTENQAINFLGDITNELKNNEDLISLFGIKEFIKDFRPGELFYDWVVGPVGSGKTTGIFFKLIHMASKQKPSDRKSTRLNSSH
mgnify:CR=1 FL=1